MLDLQQKFVPMPIVSLFIMNLYLRGLVSCALADRELALSVARHKAIFFFENDAHAKRIDYQAAVSGSLQLIPSGAAYTVLVDDYARMLVDGMLLDENETFDSLMERCASIEARANCRRDDV